ncbi:Phospholipase A1 PLIP2, chloroplastic [Linum grandiflorum]
MDGFCLNTGIHGVAPSISVSGSVGLDFRPNATYLSAGNSRDRKSTSAAASCSSSSSSPLPSRFSFRYPLQSWWSGQRCSRLNAMVATRGEESVLVDNAEAGDGGMVEGRDQNWVMKILHVRSLWKDEGSGSKSEEADVDDNSGADDEEADEEVCCVEENGEDEIEFDRDSFSRLLRKASLAEAKLYAQMSYLGNLAYCIPKIKPGNLMKYGALKLVTSSVEKRELAKKANIPAEAQEQQEEEKEVIKEEPEKNDGQHHINASTAYQIAASAASYLHSQAKCILPFDSSKVETSEDMTDEAAKKDSQAAAASLMATTGSVTAVVAAKEEAKQAVADDLSSTCSSPCEWFICDDDQRTRYIVIQGSESLESWQANLLFEPIEFEGLGVPVHRGIYEAAKGIYEQMLPEIRAHLKSYGKRATFRFTGHSLGGSLSVLINLMLLVRDEVPASSLLPVITFGSPSIMCGGDQLLRKLGLPRNHVQAITMHRDIVPRAFSCNYPSHVAELLKAVNSNFRNHPCLSNQSILYAPMGELVILQPDAKFSPQHHLLPSGSGLFFLTSNDDDDNKLLRAAQSTFMNSPHPLEILSDRSAYGSEGAIQRDHDMHSYLKSVRNVIRLEMNRIRKARREHRRKFWWSKLAMTDVFVVGRGSSTLSRTAKVQMNFSGALQTGRESIKRFSRMVASQHMHLFVVLLLPARLILLGVYNVIGSN